MCKKARQVLAILGRNNATLDCVQKTQSLLDTKKNAREILDKIIKEILYFKVISDDKIKSAINFIGGDDMLDAKMCVKCFEVKDITQFYMTPTNKNLHYWCRDCRREYDKNYKQKMRG